jgi:hypothetical protein
MKTSQKVFLGLVGIVLLVSGAYLWLHRTHLPAKRPADLVIEWQEGGGMDPTGSSVTIREGKGSREFTDWVNGQITRSTVNFVPTNADLDVLYAIIRANAFDTIKETEKEIYDGGNASVRISWGENDINILGLQVADWDRARFTNVYTAIKSYVNTHAVLTTM